MEEVLACDQPQALWAAWHQLILGVGAALYINMCPFHLGHHLASSEEAIVILVQPMWQLAITLISSLNRLLESSLEL